MLIGQKIGPFEIDREIGSGAMGTVYKARFFKDGKVIPVALKVISLGLLSNDSAVARFEREATILKQLRHPNIVRLFATGRYKQTPFIAMEFVDGQSLDKILELRGRLNWEDVAGYAKQLCAALQHAHEKGIIHRDLKPSNLMITREGKLKLTDFGIAKDTDVTALTGANSTIGTAAYMSPEQCKGDRNLTPKSDLYSLGIVLYELLTGKKPFRADNTVEMFLKHVNEPPVRPSRLVPDLPVWMDNLVVFLLEKDKNARPADADTVSKMLAEIEEKVQAQRSIGEELANARKVDVPGGGIEMDSKDREIARSLRTAPGKKRKKKKPAPWYTKKWVKALAIGLPLLAILGTGGYFVWRSFRPVGLDEQYARVEAAPSGEAKMKAAEEFLSAHGRDADPRVEKVRAVYREQKARAAEEVLIRRASGKLGRGNSEGFDEEAYRSALAALDQEKAGQLAQAADLWAAVRDKSPRIDQSKLPDDAEASKAVLAWVAERRIREISQGVPEKLKQLRAEIAEDRAAEVTHPHEPGSPEALAIRALRLERFGDFPDTIGRPAGKVGDPAKARAAWEALAAQTEKDVDQRVWYLIATQQIAQIPPEKAKEDTQAERLQRLEAVMRVLDAARAKYQDDPEARVPRRDLRNGYRDVIALYDDEPSENIKRLVAEARKALEGIPK